MEQKPSFIRYFKIAGIPFVLLLCLFTGPFVGLVAGILYGIGIAFFATSSMVKKQTAIVLPEGDNVIMSGAANHFVGMVAVGGKLYLTTQQLKFQAHKFNVQKTPFELPLNNIISVTRTKSFGIIPNGLLVESTAGKERFVVSNAAGWESAITKQKSIV